MQTGTMGALIREAIPSELGARLRQARVAGGWTQEQAANALGVARTTMVAMEKGERKVKPDELLQLSKLYGRKLSSLLRSGPPVEGFAVQLRGALPPGDELAGDLLSPIDEFERLCEDYLELERLLHPPLPRRDPPSYSLEGIAPEQLAEDAAIAERHRLGLGDAPVLNLRAVLEGELGLRIFYLDLPPQVAALYAFTEEHGGALAVNRGHSPERRRHTMAHEYGHCLIDRHRAQVMRLGEYERRPAGERFAETFSRAFLMPATGLRRRFHELSRQRALGNREGATVGDLCHLAHYYFVSLEEMARRLEELGLIPNRTWQRIHQQGFGIEAARQLLGVQEHPVDEALLPARYRYLAVEAWQRGELSEGQLAAMLRVDRLSARRLVREMGLHPEEGGGDPGSFDLFLPLAAVEAG